MSEARIVQDRLGLVVLAAMDDPAGFFDAIQDSEMCRRRFMITRTAAEDIVAAIVDGGDFKTAMKILDNALEPGNA